MVYIFKYKFLKINTKVRIKLGMMNRHTISGGQIPLILHAQSKPWFTQPESNLCYIKEK